VITSIEKWGYIQAQITNMFRKMFYRRLKGRTHQTTALTNQNVQQKSTNRVNFIGDVRLCELFSVGFNKMSRNKSILTVWSQL
jgi:hypothetical protein